MSVASRSSKIVLALSCVATTCIIGFVQYAQFKERRDRRVVVERELLELEERRRLNLIELDQQRLLTEELRRLEKQEMMGQ